MEPEPLADNISTLEKQFAAHPENVEVILALANAYADLSRWEEAVRLYKAAIALDPENGDLYNRLGIVFVVLDDQAEAEESYFRAIEYAPGDARPYFNLGLLYERQNRRSNAKYIFEKFLQLSSDPDERAVVLEKLTGL